MYVGSVNLFIYTISVFRVQKCNFSSLATRSSKVKCRLSDQLRSPRQAPPTRIPRPAYFALKQITQTRLPASSFVTFRSGTVFSFPSPLPSTRDLAPSFPQLRSFRLSEGRAAARASTHAHRLTPTTPRRRRNLRRRNGNFLSPPATCAPAGRSGPACRLQFASRKPLDPDAALALHVPLDRIDAFRAEIRGRTCGLVRGSGARTCYVLCVC
jgi:hypothetical protein